MRDWKRWTAVLLAGSLAFTAADDMKLIVQAYEMQNEQGQESYQAESKSKLDDLKKKKQFSFRNFRAKNRDLTERAPSMSAIMRNKYIK